MESHSSDLDPDQVLDDSVLAVLGSTPRGQAAVDSETDGAATERAARARVFDEVLAGVELVLAADGVAFWREESDHSLVLTAARSILRDVLDALDRHVVMPLQSIMQRWPDSPLVAISLEDTSNTIAEEIRSVAEKAEIVGIAGVPCRIPGEMLGLLIVVHRRPHPWTVRDLGLATGFAGQLATAMQNSRLYASVRSLANRLTAIHELSLRLASLRDVDSIIEAIVTEAGRVVDCDTVRVYRDEPDRGGYCLAAAAGTFLGVVSPPMAAMSAGHVETLPGWVAKRNEPVIVPDAAAERRSIVRSAHGPESLLLVPMAYGDEVHGVLVVSKSGANRYGNEDEQALSIFGRYAGQAIVNASNIERLERQQSTLERQLAGERRLLNVSEQLVSTLDPRQVLEQIADTIGSVVHYDRLTIYRHDRESGGIEAVLSRENSGAAPVPDTTRHALDEGLTSWVIGRGDAVCANDVAEGVLAGALGSIEGSLDCSIERPPAARAGTRGVRRDAGDRGRERATGAGSLGGRIAQNIIVVPLRVHGQVVGSLNLSRVGGPEAHFTEPEFELSKLFAGQASIALQNAETHVTVSTRADLDALTGLRNQGTFQRDLQALIDAADPFSLLMMDLDSFKAFNDTYGHPAGDALLQTVAKAVVGATRQNDRAYRYGGDEFALLLVGASSHHAEEVAGRVRVAVREAIRVSPVGGIGLPFGASVGAAHWPAAGPGRAELVAAADAALYESKRSRTSHVRGKGSSAQEADPGAILDAARDLLTAAGAVDVARETLRHAAAIVGSRDGLVALAAESGGASASIETTPMRQLAGMGRFENTTGSIRRSEGFWGRLWDSGGVHTENEAGNGVLLGLTITVDGRVAGLIGVALPAAAVVAPERLRMLDHLAALAGAAVQRLAPRAI
jgi:diguanylate cyclase (GGDEF)-like protein